jgi:hypothetical protein
MIGRHCYKKSSIRRRNEWVRRMRVVSYRKRIAEHPYVLVGIHGDEIDFSSSIAESLLTNGEVDFTNKILTDTQVGQIYISKGLFNSERRIRNII